MRLLVVVHSRSGGTRALADAAIAAARSDEIDDVEVLDRAPGDVDVDLFRSVDGVLVATPEHFGAMAGLVKDLFERVYEPLLDDGAALPYGLIVKGRHDGAGTVRGVESIATGLGWKRSLPPLVVIGDVTDSHLDDAAEMGGSLAAGISAGIF